MTIQAASLKAESDTVKASRRVDGSAGAGFPLPLAWLFRPHPFWISRSSRAEMPSEEAGNGNRGVVLDIGSGYGVWRKHPLHKDAQVCRCVCVFVLNTGLKSGPSRSQRPAAGCRLPVGQKTSADISEWTKGFVLQEILQRPVFSQKRSGERAMN